MKILIKPECLQILTTITYSPDIFSSTFKELESSLLAGLPERKLSTTSRISDVEEKRIKEVVRGSHQKLSEDFQNIDSSGKLQLGDDLNFNEGNNLIKSLDENVDVAKHDSDKNFSNSKSYVMKKRKKRNKFFKILKSHLKKRTKRRQRKLKFWYIRRNHPKSFRRIKAAGNIKPIKNFHQPVFKKNSLPMKRSKRQDYYVQGPEILTYDSHNRKLSNFHVPWPYTVVLDDGDPSAKYFYDTDNKVIVKQIIGRTRKKKKPPKVEEEVDEEDEVGLRSMNIWGMGATTTTTTGLPFIPTKRTDRPLSNLMEHWYPPYPRGYKKRY